MISVAIRLILTAALLIVAWRNSHWSVALLLTLLSAGAELTTVALKRRRDPVDVFMERLRSGKR